MLVGRQLTQRARFRDQSLTSYLAVVAQTLMSRWKVGLVEKGTIPMEGKSSEFTHPTVCGHDYFSRCVSSFLQALQTPPPSLITNQKFFAPTRAPTRTLPRMRSNRAGNPLRLPPLSWSSVGCETPRMPSVRSNLLLVAFALCWKIVRYGPPPTRAIRDTHRHRSERRQISKR
jgi:hypothetical protein